MPTSYTVYILGINILTVFHTFIYLHIYSVQNLYWLFWVVGSRITFSLCFTFPITYRSGLRVACVSMFYYNQNTVPWEWGDLVFTCCVATNQVTPSRLLNHPSPQVSHLLQREWPYLISQFPLAQLCHSSVTSHGGGTSPGNTKWKRWT